jgi:hypothetical protein
VGELRVDGGKDFTAEARRGETFVTEGNEGHEGMGAGLNR